MFEIHDKIPGVWPCVWYLTKVLLCFNAFKNVVTFTAKITALKKSVTKGDKKKKKEVQDEIAQLEADLEKRHKEEEEHFNQNSLMVGSFCGSYYNILVFSFFL